MLKLNWLPLKITVRIDTFPCLCKKQKCSYKIAFYNYNNDDDDNDGEEKEDFLLGVTSALLTKFFLCVYYTVTLYYNFLTRVSFSRCSLSERDQSVDTKGSQSQVLFQVQLLTKCAKASNRDDNNTAQGGLFESKRNNTHEILCPKYSTIHGDDDAFTCPHPLPRTFLELS